MYVLKKGKFFETVYSIRMRFNFLQSCHDYTLQMINLDSHTNESNREHNEKWLFVPNHLYRILIIGEKGKANALLNLIKEQNGISKIY